jgi:DNA invertase Pin-like site-specific DNA recombinase
LGIYCRTSQEKRDDPIPSTTRQKNAGIDFATKNKFFNYQVYEDQGISGYKTSEDEFEPMNNRPALSNLIEDIKSGKIDKVWVWEHSRLSRNTYTSAFIFNIFERYNITLYENDKVFDLNNPMFKLQRQFLDAISEYERHLIVNRLSSGRERKINQGERVHSKLYGYKKMGKDDKGHVVWEAVQSELETYKIAVDKYFEGMSLRKICTYLFQIGRDKYIGCKRPRLWAASILRKYQYTGYQLTIEGYEIYRKFYKMELDNLSALKDRKYWVKSAHYTEEVISIEQWIEINHKLQIKKKRFHEAMKDRKITARSALATGLFECGECGCKYYYKQIDYEVMTGKKRYHTYFHLVRYKTVNCSQKPHSFKVEAVDNIFKLSFFYFYIVFDNTVELSKKTQQRLKLEKLSVKDKIETLNKETRKIEKQIPTLRKALETEKNIKTIQIIASTIAEYEEKIESQSETMTQLDIEYQQIQGRFDKSVMEAAYYDVTDRVNDFFCKLDTEQQRNELIKIIKKAVVFNHHLIIDTGAVIFLFDIRLRQTFDMRLLENMNKGKIYKEHFITGENEEETRKRKDDVLIVDVDFNKFKESRMSVFEYMRDKLNIIYNIGESSNLVSFTGMRMLDTIQKFGIVKNK